MKRVTVLAGLSVFALLIPVLLMGLLLSISGDRTSPSRKALEEIPPELIGTYQAAAATCEGLDWTILAAVHKTETGFGTGPAMSSAGAQGPMQFMPATFQSYGTDGDGDGVADINDVEDAIFSAAALLCANGASDPARLADALWQYNHSDAYVSEILATAVSYQGDRVTNWQWTSFTGRHACPVLGSVRFSDTFGAARSRDRTHEGVDMFAPKGTPLVAVTDGTTFLVENSDDDIGGISLWIRAANGDSYFYAHNWRNLVRADGVSVRAGQLIALLGRSGNARATSPHLHFEVHPAGGPAVNPTAYVTQICD